MKKKCYVIPGLWEKYEIIIPFLSIYRNNPEYFYDDINIEAVFGNFCHSIWDGGRCSDSYQKFAFLEDIQQIQNIYNNILNISMRFVCSNSLIQLQDCKDKFNNLILQLCENNQNNIIINNQILENYIRNVYPKYKFISSTTKCLNNDEDIIKELKKDYLYVCLSYNKNYDINFLKNIPDNLKNKVELLINERCTMNCPKRNEHYMNISKVNYFYNTEFLDDFKCFRNTKEKYENNTIISYLELDKYIQLNINHFKLQGRWGSDNYAILWNLITYCVKPMFHLFLFEIISQSSQNFNLSFYKLNDYKDLF